MENQPQKQQDSLESMLEGATKRDILIMLQTVIGQIEMQLGIHENRVERKPTRALNVPNLTNNQYCEQEDAGRDMHQVLFEQDISVPIAHVNNLFIKVSNFLDEKTIVNELKGKTENFKRRLKEAMRNLPKSDPNIAILKELSVTADVITELTNGLADDQPTGTAKEWTVQLIDKIHNLLARQKPVGKKSTEGESPEKLLRNDFRKQVEEALEEEDGQNDRRKNWFLDSSNYEG